VRVAINSDKCDKCLCHSPGSIQDRWETLQVVLNKTAACGGSCGLQILHQMHQMHQMLVVARAGYSNRTKCTKCTKPELVARNTRQNTAGFERTCHLNQHVRRACLPVRVLTKAFQFLRKVTSSLSLPPPLHTGPTHHLSTYHHHQSSLDSAIGIPNPPRCLCLPCTTRVPLLRKPITSIDRK
jgi:hypothetical protein